MGNFEVNKWLELDNESLCKQFIKEVKSCHLSYGETKSTVLEMDILSTNTKLKVIFGILGVGIAEHGFEVFYF